MHYAACEGHPHPLDGQEIDFGEHGISREEVPSPWRDLLVGVDGAGRGDEHALTQQV
jgi:hypothetical protein